MISTNNRFTTPVRTRVPTVEDGVPSRGRVSNTVSNNQRRAIAIRWPSEGYTDVNSDNEGNMMDTRE